LVLDEFSVPLPYYGKGTFLRESMSRAFQGKKPHVSLLTDAAYFLEI
jgi:hypothetical protein